MQTVSSLSWVRLSLLIAFMSMKVVWILGAGFSKSLGGPLIQDLFSAGLHQEIEAWGRAGGPVGKVLSPIDELGRRLYWTHKIPDKDEPNEKIPVKPFGPDNFRLWRNVEEFIGRLDADAQSQHHQTTITAHEIATNNAPYSQATVITVAEAARRRLAAECSAFVWRSPAPTEIWAPYERWVREVVKEGDTIITFNYDVVVEHAAKVANKSLCVAVPSTAPSTQPTLYKLHGSTNWSIGLSNPNVIQIEADDFFALNADPGNWVLATPGPSKRFNTGNLSALWTSAEDAIRSRSDAIVFLGYHFPLTDSDARLKLFSALAERAEAKKPLDVHIVLAAAADKPDVYRLLQLLTFSVGKNVVKGRVFVHDLGAEDFLSVVKRKMLAPRP